MQLSTDTEVLKEPRGFIKFIEIILAICAFATATGPHLNTSVYCGCSKDGNTNSYEFQYPYKINEKTFKSPDCTNSTDGTTSEGPLTMNLSGDCKSSSEFYVFVGVIVFLYSIGAVVFYLIAHVLYSELDIVPKADLVITIFFTVFWLISASVFADAVTKIKHYTDPEWLWTSDESQFKEYSQKYGITCEAKQFANYSTVTVSVIFGFLNMFVWAGNSWFLYKETSWFGANSSPEQPMPSSAAAVEPKV